MKYQYCCICGDCYNKNNLTKYEIIIIDHIFDSYNEGTCYVCNSCYNDILPNYSINDNYKIMINLNNTLKQDIKCKTCNKYESEECEGCDARNILEDSIYEHVYLAKV